MVNTMEIIQSGTLDALSIDAMSDAIGEYIQSLGAESKEISRFRLCTEEVMEIWAKNLGESTVCQLIKTQRFGKSLLTLVADGKSVDPTQYEDDLLLFLDSNLNVVSLFGLSAQYRYYGGRNELKFQLAQKKKKKISPVGYVLIAMFAAIVVGLGMRLLCPDLIPVVSSKLISPLMNTITNVLHLIAGPLVFLSIVTGITGLGDAASFGKIGSALTKRFVVMSFVSAILMWASICWMFPISLSGGTEGEGSFSKVMEIVLDIVPSDIVSPFQTGNAMQIIFIAGFVGLGCVILGDTVLETVNFMNQLNGVVQKLMECVSKLLPPFIFLCISNLVMTSEVAQLSQIMLPLVLIASINILTFILYGLYASISTKVPFFKLLRIQLPTYLLALSTASSSAVFTTNVECCEKKLGIDSKIVRFGIPFGQVIFMPGAITMFIVLALCLAKEYGIAMTPAWILTMIFVSTVLAMAAPPIPGGAFSAVLVLFAQLGIPDAAMGICAAALSFTDYTSTACNIACLQQELLINGKKLGMLNSDSIK